MSYEIPKELKYEEKILFNLSMMQALWLGIFLLLAGAVFIKTTIPLEAKAIIAALLAAAGAGFAFFNLKSHATALAGFASSKRQAGYFDRQMSDFVEAKKICGNALFLKNGGVKAIIQVQPINFHILSESHKNAIITAYRDFLNSLDFPVQVAIRAEPLSMENYFSRLELKARQPDNKAAYSQFLEYRKFAEGHISKSRAKNRGFFIVVPAEQNRALKDSAKSEEAALSSLDSRAKICMEKLHNCNLFTKRLSSDEIASLLSGYFDCMIDARNGYFSSITAKAQ